MERREFLRKVGIVAGAAAATAGAVSWVRRAGAQDAGGRMPEETTRGDMRYRALGTTGEKVSLVGLGGWHLGSIRDDREAIALVRAAVEAGINFLDNCWDYHDGRSEQLLGQALEGGLRDEVFLMTKIDGRTREAAARQLDESLRRLRTDRIDLVQHHEVIRMEDPDLICGQGGAHEALLAAQKAGKVRFVGFTGHKDPLVHLRMLDVAVDRGLKLDAVQMPVNAFDAHFRSFSGKVLPRLVADGIAPLAMKSLGGGHLLRSGRVTAIECLHYAMTLPVATVITGIDSQRILDQALEAVKTFRPLDRAALARLLARTEDPAEKGDFEPFKTSNMFDGTAQHPEWLGLPQKGPG